VVPPNLGHSPPGNKKPRRDDGVRFKNPVSQPHSVQVRNTTTRLIPSALITVAAPARHTRWHAMANHQLSACNSQVHSMPALVPDSHPTPLRNASGPGSLYPRFGVYSSCSTSFGI